VEREYIYLTVPPNEDFRACVGLVLAGMAMRARIGIGGLEEAVESLESLHSGDAPTRYRFWLDDDSVITEVEDSRNGEVAWRAVVELVS
jgi:hypothetical protein